MAYTNSKLVNYTRISPNRSVNRNHTIDTVSIHCVVGQCSVETLGSIFASTSNEASSNYGIGYDGRIRMYVEEKDRSWCTSSASNDNHAIPIEVAPDTYHPYKVNDAAYKSLIKLLVDICKRNGIKELKWKADKNKGYSVFDENGKAVYTSKTTNTTSSFKVQISISDLNIRKGLGTNYAATGKFTGKGVFTIVETKQGTGSAKGWGKLKSGVGWIALDYATKI